MPTKPRNTTIRKLEETEKQLIKAVKGLTQEVKNLKSLEFMKVYKHPWRFMWYSFWKGVMIGLGTVFGLTVVLSLIIYLLSQIEFVPIIGEFVTEVLEQIQSYKQ